MTLSGVDAVRAGYNAINIARTNATIILEGANKVTSEADKSGLYVKGTLTIKGSGTLDIEGSGTNSTGLCSHGSMTIESGNINVNRVGANGVDFGIKSGISITVNGGYLDVTVGNSYTAIAVKATNYTQNGGYVSVGLWIESPGSITVNGATTAVTAIGASVKAYSGPTSTAVLKGAAAQYGALGTANAASDKVLLIKGRECSSASSRTFRFFQQRTCRDRSCLIC